MIIVPNSAEVALLDGTWSGLADDLDMRLFTNDVTDGLTQSEIQELDETDFTEATFPGYTAAVLAPAGWTINAGDPTVGTHSVQEFERSTTGTAETVRGYYVTDDGTGAIRWWEEFESGPVIVEFEDDHIAITPTLSLDDAEGNAVAVGEITAWPSVDIPPNKLLCDGQAVSRTEYSRLFAVVGVWYGPGDGATTFNLPDLRQRFPLGKADSGTGSTIGAVGGQIDHTHGLDTSNSHAKMTGGGSSPFIRVRRKAAPSTWAATHTSSPSGGSFGTGTDTSSTVIALGGDSGSANPPYAVVNWVIQAV